MAGLCKVIPDDYPLIYVGHKKEHKRGVGMLLNKVVAKSVIGYHLISEGILLVKPFN